MKYNIKKSLAIAAMAAAVTTAATQAQNTYSGYFLENYNYRYQMNPAFGNENNFVGMPALGNLNISFHGNLHLTSVLYNYQGRTVLFTNPNIPTSTVMKGIHDANKIGTTNKINILNAGFKAWGGYNTIGIGVVADANASVPGSLFSLLKEGITNRSYSIDNLRVSATAYAEIALNHSREIKQVPGLRVGAAMKFLLPAGNMEAYLKNASLNLGVDAWDIQAQADVYASVKNLRYKLDTNHDANPPREYVNGVDLDSFGLNGFGLGFDLGAEYDWNGFKFSAAILDLGFISYSQTQFASTNGVKSFELNKYTFDANGDDDDTTWDEMKDDLSSLYQLEDMGNTGSRTRALNATLNFAADYEFPYYRRLHFGLVNSTRFHGVFTDTQFRLSANVRPVDILSASVNFAAGTYGVGFGWLLNLNTKKGFSLFIGMDRTLGKLAKQGVPLNSNGSLNFGMDFPF